MIPLNKKFRYRAYLGILLPILLGFGPCGPIAGSKLDGTLVNETITDFRFVDDSEQCKLEVRVNNPHSVTVNCWAVGKQLFVGCKDCAGKTWSDAIVSDSAAKIKIADSLYPVKATLMSDKLAIKRAWALRWKKYEELPEPEPVPEGYWLFHLGSRPG